MDNYGTEPMTMGSPMSPGSPHGGHQSQYLPGYLLGEVTSPSPRIWSAASPTSPKSGQRGSLTSPTTVTLQRNEIMRTKERGGAPPVKGLMSHTATPSSAAHSPFGTPAQLSHLHSQRTSSLAGTPGVPTAGLSQSMTPGGLGSDVSQMQSFSGRIPPSPAQLDPFYTQGESLTTEDILDETWVTIFGFPPAASSFLLQQFSQYGNIIKHVVSSKGNWMHLHYQSKLQAKKALSKNGKIFGDCIMVGVTACIDKSVMEDDKENTSVLRENSSCFGTPALYHTPQGGGGTANSSMRNTPIRPLTAAYRAAKSDSEVVRNNQPPQKNSGLVNKAMEYMFGW